jgi:predicted NAD/FAD-dependent oxidoreductase
MRRIPEFLARSVRVQTAATVERLEAQDDTVTAIVEGGSRLTAAAAVVTPPLPQTLTLLRNSGIGLPGGTAETLPGIRYRACLAVMASLQGSSGLPDGHLSPASGPIAWMADNAHKGTSSTPSLTVHSTPAFAEAHLEDVPEMWADLLVSAARPYLSAPVKAARGHRWRYAEPTTTLESGYLLLDLSVPIILAGEVFAGARVEGAILSGLAAADVLIERLG